jgi:hypothetical protein
VRFRLVKYCFFKCKFFLVRYQYRRNPLMSLFSVTIGNQEIQGNKRELINFVQDKYIISLLRVKSLFDFAVREDLYKNKSMLKIRSFQTEHMYTTIKANLHYPIIIVSNKDGEITKILDGLHRINKAYMLRRRNIKAYIIPENELLIFKNLQL